MVEKTYYLSLRRRTLFSTLSSGRNPRGILTLEKPSNLFLFLNGVSNTLRLEGFEIARLMVSRHGRWDF